MAGVPAEGEGEVPGEEGQPAHQEGAHHHAQRHERLEIGPLVVLSEYLYYSVSWLRGDRLAFSQ